MVRRVVVIGAGLGGLAAATLLARRGVEVTVVERHTEPGGVAVTWEREGFRFDASLHHLDAVGPGQANRPLLEELGVAEALVLRREAVLRRELAPGLDLRLPQEPWELQRRLADRFGSGIRAGLEQLSRLSAEAHAAVYAGRPLGSGGRGSAAALLEELFEDPLLRRVLGGICEYVGRRPRGCPALTFLFLWQAYHVEGGWRLRGGSGALTAALVASLLGAGGRLRTGAAATATTLARGRLAGVTLSSGDHLEADGVVAALPAPCLAPLLPTSPRLDPYRQRLGTLPRSCSTWRLALGLDGDHTAGQTYETRVHGPEGSCALTLASLGDPSWAPPGCTALSVSAAAPARQTTEAERAAASARLLGAVERVIPGACEAIRVEALATPETWARYTDAPDGATMGLGPGGPRLRARTPLPGLVLAGAWVPPGPGQTAVLHSGARAARLLLGAP